jgi:hypothetical protein
MLDEHGRRDDRAEAGAENVGEIEVAERPRRFLRRLARPTMRRGDPWRFKEITAALPSGEPNRR